MRHPRRWSLVPWWLPNSDLWPANRKLDLSRDCRTLEGQPQRHLALYVTQQHRPGQMLGLLAIRCERRGERITPISLSIPESAIIVPPVTEWQSNPRRTQDGDDAA